MGLWGDQTQWAAISHLPEIPTGEFSTPNLESQALQDRPDLVAARQGVIIQARTLGITADYRFFQQIDVGPEFERETDNQWRIGPTVSVPIPLFDQGQAKIARAEAMLRQSEHHYQAMTIDIRSEVRSAAARLSHARAKALLYRDEMLPVEQNLFHQTQLQYNGMYTGVFQLLQTRRDQIQSTLQYIDSLRDYWTARVDLERAVGGRLPVNATTQPTHGEHP
jgi:cobalt-zinc-cadmium efflux system outer membrane protein